ncbi:MAG: hypothetical protein ACYDDF_05070 [Thermoplasmatota archaeon]
MFCWACGEELVLGTTVCPRCRRPVTPEQAKAGAGAAPSAASGSPEAAAVSVAPATVRPRGVFLIVVAQAISASVAFLTGVLLLALVATTSAKDLAAQLANQTSGQALQGISTGEIYTAVAALGGILAILGIAGLIAAIGIWRGRPWGRALEISLAWFGILINGFGTASAVLVSIEAAAVYGIGLVASVVIVWYFTRPEVRGFYQ